MTDLKKLAPLAIAVNPPEEPFQFIQYDLELVGAVGLSASPDSPVCVVIRGTKGICMSRDTARALAIALIETAGTEAT